jgi:ribosomal protein S18 acetylase RimI-like enzyme
VVELPLSDDAAPAADGLRPINLRTDLSQLADLLELAFANTMDSSGRAAVREMRHLSRAGPGLNVLVGLSDLAQGMGQGFVWVAGGQIVGNVSVYPAGRALPRAWVIVNVATHPDYRGRGIATRLMQAAMLMVRQRGGDQALLQVDSDNETARRLYRRLGFVDERGWLLWRRNIQAARPSPLAEPPHITHRTAREWQAEYALAAQVFPPEQGGLGWLRPLTPRVFHPSLWQRFGDWLSFRGIERLIIRRTDGQQIAASLWVESGLMATSTQLTLIVHPDYEGLYDEALLNTAVRRFGASHTLTLEYPADCIATAAVLRRYGFTPRRDVVHMRWQVR